MTTPMDDDALLALVADAVAGDGPPPDAVEAAYAAFGWRTLEADLAQLFEPEVVGFLHQPEPAARVVTFTTDHGVIEVAIDGGHVAVAASPPVEAVLLRRPDGTAEPLGSAEHLGTAPGPVRLELTWPTGTALTPWFTL